MSYLTRAALEAALVGGTCGVVGVQVVLRRLGFFAAALAHASFPGAVLAGILGLSAYAGAGVAGVLVVLTVAALHRTAGHSATVGVVLAAALALGVVLASARSGASRDVAAYLAGHLLTVQPRDLAVAATAAVLVAAALALLGKELLLAAFDRTALAAQGYPVLALDLAVLALVEIAVLAALPAAGTVLVLGLLAAPAATARCWTGSPGTLAAAAAALGAAEGVTGVALSQRYDLAGGAAVVLVGCTVLAAVLAAALAAALAVALAARRLPSGVRRWR
jgi:ABC-type Mn2+/Zn2+ transport system permease subunit